MVSRSWSWSLAAISSSHACARTSASTQRFSLHFAYLTVILHTIEHLFEFYKNYSYCLALNFLSFLFKRIPCVVESFTVTYVFVNSGSPIMHSTASARSSVVSPPCFSIASMAKTWGVVHFANTAALMDSATWAIELEISDMPLPAVTRCFLVLSLAFRSTLLERFWGGCTGLMGGFGEKPSSCQFVCIRFEWKGQCDTYTAWAVSVPCIERGPRWVMGEIQSGCLYVSQHVSESETRVEYSPFCWRRLG